MSENSGDQWTMELSVSYAIIDDQHKELIGFLVLLEASIGSNDIGGINAILADLTRFTHLHFSEEEKLMRDNDYPDYFAHVMRHESLLEEIRQLQVSIDAGKTPVSLALLGFLRVWLFEHMKSADRKLGAFLNGRPGR